MAQVALSCSTPALLKPVTTASNTKCWAVTHRVTEAVLLSSSVLDTSAEAGYHLLNFMGAFSEVKPPKKEPIKELTIDNLL